MASSGPLGSATPAIAAAACPAPSVAPVSAACAVVRFSNSLSDSVSPTGIAVAAATRGSVAARRGLGTLGRRHLARLAVARANAELLLDLQVGEPAHRFRRHGALRSFLEEAPVTRHGHVEALLDLDVLQVGLRIAQLGERVPLGGLGAAGDQHRSQHERQCKAAHHGCTPAVCRREARS